MNRINKLFENRKKKILSVYFTAGYPELNNTLEIIRELDKSGVDMIEIGMPFSDPVADGPVIQRSSEKALKNGMSLNLLFEQLPALREITDIPIVLMGYINPVFRFGVEKFLRKCSETGIDGIIIPDLPVEEYIESYESLFKSYNILNVFLVSPQTPEERILYLDRNSKGFLYIVSTAATTGGTKKFDRSQINYFRKMDDLNLKTPRLIGFGISDKTTYEQACEYSDGVIIGSAFIKSLDEKGSLPEKIHRFVRTIR
ncbi:MAG: tryptophan synthase subunit alpha [Bacteroidetes bacterium GWA2_40_15]|nr:MAG: tryptophan synthase subunit alpha [Bacteroidetes bacterium GWA2_40_15]HBQ81967.1 tryptophan synthase subunit alpha [Bacteroidales bacterium]